MAPRHVVERCPSCGVEHEAPGNGACEACGATLRRWCRVHGRESGWLESAECRRCAEDAFRPAPPPRPASAPRREVASLRRRPITAPTRTHPDSPVPWLVPGPDGRLVPMREGPLPLWMRVVGVLMSTLASGVGGAAAGVVGGAFYGIFQGSLLQTAGAWGMGGGILGMLFGVFHAVALDLPGARKK